MNNEVTPRPSLAVAATRDLAVCVLLGAGIICILVAVFGG